MNQGNERGAARPFPRLAAAALALLLLTALAGGGYVFFYTGERNAAFDADWEPPVVKAEVIKVTPVDPGGMEIPHQDKLVYDRLTAKEADATEIAVLAADAEEPFIYLASDTHNGNATTAEPGESAAGQTSGYVAQLASYAGRAEAEDGLEKIKSRYPHLLTSLTMNIQSADLGQRGIRHRLHVGYFSTRSQARDVCNKFRAHGFDCRVTLH